MVSPTCADAVAPCLHASFPNWRSGPVHAREAQETTAGMPAARDRVLVVEDNYLVALEAELALDEAGFEVVGIAADAEEALALATARRPHLVVMDIRLLGSVDGIEAAARIHAALSIPSLFATAHSDAATRARGEAAVPDARWLIKPYAPDALVGAVKAALADRRRQD